MTAFISAGHHLKDPGAIGNGKKESDLTREFRDMVVPILKCNGVKVITDKDSETLGQYLSRIKTGTGSVVLEFHFDAAIHNGATGTTCLIGNDADRLDKAFAKELVDATSEILGIRNRGVKSESESGRGRLGLMRESGTVALLEICFITNEDDLKAYDTNKVSLACRIAEIVKKYEDLAA